MCCGIPKRPFAATRHGVAQALFPTHAVIQRGTLDNATARPAHELRLQSCQHLGHILAQPVLPSFESILGKQRYIIHPHHRPAGCAENDTQFTMTGIRSGLQGGGQFRPMVKRSRMQRFASYRLPLLHVIDFHCQCPFITGRVQVETQIILFAFFHGHAPITAVGQRHLTRAVNLQFHGVRRVLMQRIFRFRHLVCHAAAFGLHTPS